MSQAITHLTLFFLSALLLLIVVELIKVRNYKKFILELLILAAIVIVLNLTVGFPKYVQSFGGVSPAIAIGIMFICVILGIWGRYLFIKKKNESFSWVTFVKPVFISPIVLLPLIGSIQTTSSIESIQLICLSILAYQNGFFWKIIVDRADEQMNNTTKV